jgi:Flp pilus assembly protein TadB
MFNLLQILCRNALLLILVLVLLQNQNPLAAIIVFLIVASLFGAFRKNHRRRHRCRCESCRCR